MHRQTAERIAAAAGITKSDTVLEIGPGTGMLTKSLLARAKQVIAIEADTELAGALRELFSKELASGALVLLAQDVRAFDSATINTPYLLVANIPYYLTGMIVRTFLESAHRPTSMTLLVQKEVAERVARSKKESLLSLAVKAYGTPQYVFTVPRGAFTPAPAVDSAVLSITHIQNPFKNEEEGRRFFSLIHAGFAHKRKRLAKNLEMVLEKGFVLRALSDARIPKDARAEDVALVAWLRLAAISSGAHVSEV